MGIYPNVTYTTEYPPREPGQTVLVRTTTEPGKTTVERFQLIETTVNRTDCFCCSCGEREGSDPACRNHGWAASRPCEVHGMPGSAWDDTCPEIEGQMPESVQTVLARRA